MTATAALDSAKYISLVTFRRNGREVRTPVWFVALGEKLYVMSVRDAGKMKRVRATGKVRFAVCDIRGRVRGNWLEGEGRLANGPEMARQVYGALAAKYGWSYRISTFLSLISRNIGKRALLEITPAAEAVS